LLQLTVPDGATAAPASVSVTVAVQVVEALRVAGFGAQPTVVDVVRVVTVRLVEPADAWKWESPW